MNSINNKEFIKQLSESSEISDILSKVDNSDSFRFEMGNRELDFYYRIKRSSLNSLYWKLLAYNNNPNINLNKIT